MLTSRAHTKTASTAATGTATLAVVAASHVGVDTVAGSVTALLPTLGDRFTLSGTEVGALVATISASSLLAQPLAGRLADRLGAKRITVAGALLSAALLSLIGVAGHIAVLYALLVVGGLGSAGFHPAAAVAARRVLPERAGLAVSLFSAGGRVGLALGPLAVLLIAAHAGLGFTPLLMIPATVLALVLWRILPADPARPPARPRAGVHLLRGPVGSLAASGTLAAVAVTTFNAGIPLWLTDQDLTGGAIVIGLTLAAFELAAAAGGIGASWLAGRIAPSIVATASLLAAPVPLVAALVARPGSPAFYLAVLAAGALSNAATPLLIVAAQDRAPDAVAAASGMLMGFANGVAGIAFVGVGAIADLAGLRTGLVVGFAAAIPAAALAARSLGRRPSSTPLTIVGPRPCACTACPIPLAA